MFQNTMSKQADAQPRLPCRGCTRGCVNYPVCNGSPWRLAASVAKKNTNKCGIKEPYDDGF